MTPVPGHPYVTASVTPDGWGAHEIRCHCQLCGEPFRHRCEYLPKANVWIARFAAHHAHGVPGVREQFAHAYHTGLQALRG